MFYIQFKDGKAVGMTVFTQHALFDPGHTVKDGWEVEAHDKWPERRNLHNLLKCEWLGKELPANVGSYTVDRFYEKFIEQEP